MKFKGLVGGIVILASIILLSALQISTSLENIATATMGYLTTSEPSLLTSILYVLSVLLLIGGIALVICDLFSQKKTSQ